jgi:hypothetical protein
MNIVAYLPAGRAWVDARVMGGHRWFDAEEARRGPAGQAGATESGARSPAVANLLFLQRTAGNLAVQRGLGEFLGKVKEGVEQVFEVGPFDALTASGAADEARTAAEASGLPGFSDGPQDAFRHAYWSSLMALSIGESQAEDVGDTHEEQATTHPNVTAMDHFNNRVGRELAKQAKRKQECYNLVMAALRKGDLVVIPNWRARQEARRAGTALPDAQAPVRSNANPDDLKTAVAEREAIVRGGAKQSADWLGWKHGGWWVEYEYRVEGAWDGTFKVMPFNQWQLTRDRPDAVLYPIDTEPREARNRLNELGGPHDVADWPLRKVLKLYVRGSYALTVTLDGKNKVVSTGTEYLDPRIAQRLHKEAGWDNPGRDLADWVWSGTGGLPPDIDRLR